MSLLWSAVAACLTHQDFKFLCTGITPHSNYLPSPSVQPFMVRQKMWDKSLSNVSSPPFLENFTSRIISQFLLFQNALQPLHHPSTTPLWVGPSSQGSRGCDRVGLCCQPQPLPPHTHPSCCSQHWWLLSPALPLTVSLCGRFCTRVERQKARLSPPAPPALMFLLWFPLDPAFVFLLLPHFLSSKKASRRLLPPHPISNIPDLASYPFLLRL